MHLPSTTPSHSKRNKTKSDGSLTYSQCGRLARPVALRPGRTAIRMMAVDQVPQKRRH